MNIYIIKKVLLGERDPVSELKCQTTVGNTKGNIEFEDDNMHITVERESIPRLDHA